MDQKLRVLADYLLARNDASDVKPRDIDAKALPHLFILNIERSAEGKRSGLRVRFTGTALDNAFQRKLVGSLIEDHVHGRRASDVLESRCPWAAPSQGCVRYRSLHPGFFHRHTALGGSQK